MAAAESFNFARHRNLYKRKTPPWKETYRRRCLERLKKSRDDVVERFRRASSAAASFVCQVMREEWTALNLGPPCHPMLKNGAEEVKSTSEDVSSSEVDYVLDLVEEIKMELLNEEQQILKEYEAIMELETGQIDAMLSPSTESSRVLCPICKSNFFVQNSTSVHCQCGISLQVDEGVDLSHLQQQLFSGVSRHNIECQADPAFSVTAADGISNLLITCSVCDFMFIVL